jgi:hypothetical protein
MVLGALAGLAIAILTYRPDRALPFDILDFSEFLPLLQGIDSFSERTRALIDYYASQGRANLVPYVLMSAKWSWFGDWSPGWQWSRFTVMAGCVLLAFRLLSRLGATPMGALLGASLFFVHPAAARGWIRLTMAEPLGTLLLLLLCLWVLGRRRGGWPWAPVIVLVPLILLTKEMLVATLALPVALLCLTDDAGRLARPSLRPVAVRFFVLAAVVSAIVLVPIVMVMLSVQGAAFSAQYGSAWRSAGDTIASWLATIITFDPSRTFPPRAMGLALISLLLLLGWGWWSLLRDASRRREHLGLLGLGLGFPLIGAIAYAPWPAYQGFYAIPFLFGTSILVAFAEKGLESSSRVARTGWLGGFAVLLLASLADANGQAGRAAASQHVHQRVAQRVASLAVDTVLVASDRVVTQEWQGLGPTLARYAAATAHPWPPTRDTPCTGIDALDPGAARLAIVHYSSLCPLNRDESPIVERYARFDPARLSFVRDSLRVDVVQRGGLLPGTADER